MWFNLYIIISYQMQLLLRVSKSFVCNYCIRTVWEIKQKTLVDMAVDRGCYIDQSQSLNVHMEQPNFGKLTSLHFHAWSKVFSLESIDCLHNHFVLSLK
jgi:hypothetical protein